jgi:hypothetical protein
MTVGELREALAGFPDDAPVQVHMERLPDENEDAFVVRREPLYAGWSERVDKPHLVLFAEHFPKDWIAVTRDRVVERAKAFSKFEWPYYGRWDFWNAPQWKRRNRCSICARSSTARTARG